MNTQRHSKPADPEPLPQLTDDERAQCELKNGLRQFDRLRELIDQAIIPGANFRLRPSVLVELNRLAIQGLEEEAGRYRRGSIEISGSKHTPPAADDIARYVDDMCEYVENHWASATALHLSSYVMWRLNWIHPFVDGNGRTTRAASYLVLCVKAGYRLPGSPTIPERIADGLTGRSPYYGALDAADAADLQGRIDVSAMEELLKNHLSAQLLSVFEAVTGEAASPSEV